MEALGAELTEQTAEQPERQVSSVSEQRHLEDSQRFDVWNLVNPARETSIVPKLPEETAPDSGQAPMGEDAPISDSKSPQHRSLGAFTAKAQKDQERRNPQQRKKKSRNRWNHEQRTYSGRKQRRPDRPGKRNADPVFEWTRE